MSLSVTASRSPPRAAAAGLLRRGSSPARCSAAAATLQTASSDDVDGLIALAKRSRFLVAGNWKCNGTTASITLLLNALNDSALPASVEAVCAPPFLYLPLVKSLLKEDRYSVAAQNLKAGGPGAFTGEITAEMLADLRIPWVIVGHSERRTLYHETDDDAAAKAASALAAGLSVMFCVGETLAEREANQTLPVIMRQLKALLEATKTTGLERLVVAYEPVWAIGTGKVATPEQAQEVHAAIREYLNDALGRLVAMGTRVLYGGSVNPSSAEALASMPDIDGFLVGGASLKPTDFVAICRAARVRERR